MGRSKYLGKWVEPVSSQINLPYTVACFRQVLEWGLSPLTPYTHHDIASWCWKFRSKYFDDTIDATADIERILPLLADVDAQWDMFLSNTFSLQELQQLDFTVVRLPEEWFPTWLEELEKLS